MVDWYTKLTFKANHIKSIQTTFKLKQYPCPNVYLNDIPIPTSPTIKYLSLTLIKRLTWAHRIKQKRISLNNRIRMLKLLICKNYTLPLMSNSSCTKLG